MPPKEESKPRLKYAEDIGSEGSDKGLVITESQQNKLDGFTHHKRVADYLLGKTIGEGSFARVRLGLHVHTAQEVAVKVISKAKVRKDPYMHKNLRREGRILQMIQHENIVQVYDILETCNNYYIVTEYCGGGELIDIVTEKGNIPEVKVKKYISQLVSAVAHLHNNGVVHRDLKVENLLLDENGDLKVIDFGLSNVIPDEISTPYSFLSTQCGSPAYAAPELLAKRAYGPKVDVWSIGVITYALLVGKLPFTAEPFRIPTLCRKMITGDMNPIPYHLTKSCRNFMKGLMIPEPKKRPDIWQVSKMQWVERMVKSKKWYKPYRKHLHSSVMMDIEVITEMETKHGFESSKVANTVRKNRPGEVLAMYFLLAKLRSQRENAVDKDKADRMASNCNKVKKILSETSDERTDFTEMTEVQPQSMASDSQSKEASNISSNTSSKLIASARLDPCGDNVQGSHPRSASPTTAILSNNNEVKRCAHELSEVDEQVFNQPDKCLKREHRKEHSYCDHQSKLPILHTNSKRNVVSSCKSSSQTDEIKDVKLYSRTSVGAETHPRLKFNHNANKAKPVNVPHFDAISHFDHISNARYIDKRQRILHDEVAINGSLTETANPTCVCSRVSGSEVQNRSSGYKDFLPEATMNKMEFPTFTSLPQRKQQEIRAEPNSSRFYNFALPFIYSTVAREGSKVQYPALSFMETGKRPPNNGNVREIIEKFDGMLGNFDEIHGRGSPVIDKYMRLSVLRTEHDHTSCGKRASKLSQQKESTAQYVHSKGKVPSFVKKYDELNFKSHFIGRSQDSRMYTKTKRSDCQARQKTRTKDVWYKSLV